MILAAAFRNVNKALRKIGDFISTIFLVIFYFSIFGLFALPARIIGDFLKRGAVKSTFSAREKEYNSLDSFRYEG